MNKLLLVSMNEINNGKYIIEYYKKTKININGKTILNNYDLENHDLIININNNSSLELNKLSILKNDLNLTINLLEKSNLFLNLTIINSGSNNVKININMKENNSKAIIKLRARNIGDSSLNIICNGTILATKNNELLEDLKGLINGYDTIKISPNLIVNTNEVLANHLVTIGSINNEELFYLKSLGIKEDIAIKMLTNAFTKSILNEELRKYISDGGDNFE